jgi:hypothetical protein
MTRQITITLDGVQYMVDVDIERASSDIIYHVSAPQHFKDELPDTFDMVQPENAEQPEYNEQAFTEKSRRVVQAIWQQLKTLPPQFKGGKNTGQA